jgi:hypothetical protein
MSAWPITAALAVEDLREYAGQLRAEFPWSAAGTPFDSVDHVRMIRAQAWLDRLRAISSTWSADAWLLTTAMVAMQAERDSIARQYIDAFLSASRNAPVQQSIGLATAVALFADGTLSNDRLVRTLPWAESYAVRSLKLPTNGYRTRSESLQVRRSKTLVLQMLLSGIGAMSVVPFASVDRVLQMLSTLPYDDRHRLIVEQLPYRHIAEAAMRLPHGRSRLDTLDTRLFALGRRREAEEAAGLSPADRITRQQRDDADVRGSMAPFASIGTPAPSVVAHAWLHTADSLYAQIPRTHTLADGVIHVLAFGDKDAPMLPALDRVQQRFPRRVQVVFITETEGHGGPDLLSPADEVAWLSRFYTYVRRVKIPIALWAGEKVPQEHAGPYQRYLPLPSPVPAAYRLATRGSDVVIVDGHGMIRASRPLATPAHESQLVKLLIELGADGASGLISDTTAVTY